MGLGLTLTETLLEGLDCPEAAWPHGSWEVGRLVLAPEYRTDPDALRRCLYLALAYLCRYAEARSLYASCTHVLSRLYRRFGFSVFAREVPLAGTSKTYSLIHGYAPQVLEALEGQSARSQPQ